MYDYLIVGSGLFGSVFAHEANKQGSKCLVIDKRAHIGGNCYTKQIEGINTHVYGPHIFNTNNTKIWNYINQFCEFEQYVHRVKVNFNNKIYHIKTDKVELDVTTNHRMWVRNEKDEYEELIDELKNKIVKYETEINLLSVDDDIDEDIDEQYYNNKIEHKNYKHKKGGNI